jgi:hypothetical protein
MELHTRDDKDEIALAQLGAAGTMFQGPCSRTSCMWPRRYKAYRQFPTRASGGSVSLRVINSRGSERTRGPNPATSARAGRVTKRFSVSADTLTQALAV